MPAPLNLPGNANVYVPFFDVQGGLIVGFARNIRDFPLNHYVQIVPANFERGKYLFIDPRQAARIKDKSLKQFVWADGQAAPDGTWNVQEFEFRDYFTQRYVYPWALGFRTVQQASWDIVSSHSMMAAQQAITARTVKVIETLKNFNWGPNEDTATSLGGGKWDAGDSENPYIKKTLNTVARKILQSTVGAVKPRDLILIISPVLASRMAESKEVHTYLRESIPALEVLRGTISEGQQLYERNATWGLPPTLYGYRILVEDTIVVVEGRRSNPEVTQFVMPDDTAFLISRPGGLEGVYGHPTFSTVTMFTYRPEEFLPEYMYDPNNRRHVGRVIDNFDVVVTAPISGFKITECI
jgi:hypothetical protein